MKSDTTMDFNTFTDEEFRQRFSRWLTENCPAELRKPVVMRMDKETETAWLRKLKVGGWRAPSLPREYGGMGLSLTKQLIYREVMDSHRVARVFDLGLLLLAPVLIAYGTPQQKEHYLPRILNCDDHWCQGYSEPGAGSDLASLRMRAELHGDRFVVNGQKIWTSNATAATHIFMLVRTNNQGRKQQGITFMLAEMDAPGIAVRPIPNLSGDEEFCEVFFDNVEIPAQNVVGEVDKGWDVAKSLLGVERLMTGSPSFAQFAFGYLLQLIDGLGLWPQMERDERFIRVATDLHDAVVMYEQVCDAVIAGRALTTEHSTIKIISSEIFQRVTDLALELAAERSGLAGESNYGTVSFDVRRLFTIARAASIYGGAGEVQRDIIARLLIGSTSGAR
jgi:alkylation response protein AidB-like acyl-CoA dehydrogenase